MLGVHFSPAGTSTTHVDRMVERGLDWVERLRGKPLSHSDAWLSFFFQLFPAICWGLVTVCMKPALLDKKFQKVYAKALPYLGVNCKIRREWRSLPEMYQGLALPNFPLIALSEKLLFLLDNWGLRGQAQRDALAMAYRTSWWKLVCMVASELELQGLWPPGNKRYLVPEPVGTHGQVRCVTNNAGCRPAPGSPRG
jgi:hypothetical protein